MSQKKARKARRQRKEELEARIEAKEAQMVKKPSFVRLYDKLFPGEYTRKQDLKHMIGVFIVILIVMAAIAFTFYNITEREKQAVSTKILIPATSFVDGQEKNVVGMLEGYGFRNIDVDENGNIIAYGTPQMVEDYKNSYKEDILEPVKKTMLEDLSAYGILAISVTDDGKTLTIKTMDDFAATDSIMMRAVVGNDKVNRIIYVCSNWCQLRNDGERMTVNMELAGSTDPYYTSTPLNGDAMIAEIEAKERAESSTNKNESSEGEETQADNANETE